MKRAKTIGITLGDPAGIGAEVTAKALSQSSLRSSAHYILIGDRGLFNRHFPKSFQAHCSLVDTGHDTSPVKLGRPSRQSGEAALSYLQRAVRLLEHKTIDALVTAPVSKEAITSSGTVFHGHTEFLAAAFNIKNFEMMFICDELKTVIVTRHLPLKDVSGALTKQKIYDTLALVNQSLQNQFRIRQPKIAVCGLNPHAGEQGLMGKEELKIILPAIQQAQADHIKAAGPFAADTLFTPDNRKKYDVFVAMYHDQGLIPVKTLYFKKVVNLTIGLPFVRTSPAHGTAFDIAGKNKADPSSMHEAIRLAVRLSH